RPDALIATGRSDYPNQVNNVLCFPFLFRGALDCGATEINGAMKAACVRAIADLAMAEPSDTVRSAYGGQKLRFGPEYLIPKPFDPRLMPQVAPAVAAAAMDSGVARRPIADLEAYRQGLHYRVVRSAMVMKPVFDRARESLKRVVYAEGEQETVILTAGQVVAQGIARPILIGRREVIEARIEDLGLRLVADQDFDIVEPTNNLRAEAHRNAFYERARRRGYSPGDADEAIRRDTTALAAAMILTDDADALICGTVGQYRRHVRKMADIIGTAPGVDQLAAMNGVVLQSRVLFFADTYVHDDPDAEAIAEIARLCAKEVSWFGIEPKVALVSHSNFGSHDTPSAEKMRRALELILAVEPELEVEGEMHADLALSETLRSARFPESRLTGRANLLVAPNQDAANIAFNMLKILGGGTVIGPILVGAARSVHVVTPSITVRGLLNMTALAAVRARS
ncbi:MAG: phosphate acyltransferase, partial [Chromatiales bacterium]